MPTIKKSSNIVFDDDVFEKLEDFRFNNRFQNRSQAVMFVIKAGMNALKDEYPELDLNTKLETGKKQKNVFVNKSMHISKSD